jgi:hypothetical protein
VAGNRVSELALFREILPAIPIQAILIADSYFSGFPCFALCRQAGLDLVTRLNLQRDINRLRREGNRLGFNDWRVQIDLNSVTKKNHPESVSWPQTLPARLLRCDFLDARRRTITVWLATTLLDPHAYPREEIIELYRSRWGIETTYHHLKTTLDMNVLRGKTPENVRGEIAATLLAHNLILTLMLQTSLENGIPLDRLSFAATVKIVLAFSPRLAALSSAEMFQDALAAMSRLIARYANRHRPGRHESFFTIHCKPRKNGICTGPIIIQFSES